MRLSQNIRRALGSCAIHSHSLKQCHVIRNDMIVDQKLESHRGCMSKNIDDVLGIGFIRHFAVFIIDGARWIFLQIHRRENSDLSVLSAEDLPFHRWQCHAGEDISPEQRPKQMDRSSLGRCSTVSVFYIVDVGRDGTSVDEWRSNEEQTSERVDQLCRSLKRRYMHSVQCPPSKSLTSNRELFELIDASVEFTGQMTEDILRRFLLMHVCLTKFDDVLFQVFLLIRLILVGHASEDVQEQLQSFKTIIRNRYVIGQVLKEFRN